MIPKIIHQTSKTSVIPEKWAAYQNIVQSLHPDWEYRLWTDEDNDRMVQEYFPQYLNTFRTLPKGIMRADVIRYVLMYIHGGLYLDLDYEFLKPFDLIDQVLVLPVERFETEGPFVGNSVFASAPGHQFWLDVLEEWSVRAGMLPAYVSEEDILQTTGPGLLTRVFRRSYMHDTSVYLPKVMAFNPPIPRDEKAYRRLRSDAESYGIHHCHGTWRALTLRQRLVERAKKLLVSLRSGS